MESEAEGPAPPREGPSFIFRDLALLQLAALVVLCDQLTKFLVREYLGYSQSFPAEGFFRLTHTFNTGSAFGLFQGQNTPLVVVAVVGIIILGLIYRSQKPPGNLLRLSLGLQVGGAVGNLTDRLLFGHVTDFLDVGAWPIFNLADSSIVVGLVLLAWVFLKPGRRRDESPAAGPSLLDAAPTCHPAEAVDESGLTGTGKVQPSDSRLERYEEDRRWLRLDR